MGARQVPDDERPRARAASPTACATCRRRRARSKSRELKPDPQFATFLKIFANPKSPTIADHGGRARQPGAVPELHRQVAGGQGRRPAGRARGRRQADRRAAQAAQAAAGGCRERRAGGRARPPPRRRRPTAGGARRRAAWRRRRSCSRFMSPWLVGFTVFFGYPLVDERLPLVHPLRPALAAALGRARRTTATCSTTTRRSGPRCGTRSG